MCTYCIWDGEKWLSSQIGKSKNKRVWQYCPNDMHIYRQWKKRLQIFKTIELKLHLNWQSMNKFTMKMLMSKLHSHLQTKNKLSVKFQQD